MKIKLITFNACKSRNSSLSSLNIEIMAWFWFCEFDKLEIFYMKNRLRLLPQQPENVIVFFFGSFVGGFFQCHQILYVLAKCVFSITG